MQSLPKTHLVAGRPDRVDGVTVAALAALPAAEAPRVRSAAVAVLTHHVGLAGALAAAPVTPAVLTG